jgi:hypothetical protein
MQFSLTKYIQQTTSIAPLAMFRFLMGLVMAISIVRFAANGWIESQYIQPSFHFKYFGFEWVSVPSATALYALFLIQGLAFLAVALGFYYRLSIVTAFLSFTWVELMDITYYLNHYYFISLVLLLMCFLPAAQAYSLDAYRKKQYDAKVPIWTIHILKFQIALVYVFAGIAKINSEWLLEANPLKIWLPVHSDFPFIGFLFTKTWVAYVFSWFGMIYDVCIVFFLLNSKTRNYAYVFVVIFHILTWLLFPIGMFPWVMMLATLIFFSEAFHLKVLQWIGLEKCNIQKHVVVTRIHSFSYLFLGVFLIIQVLLPMRYLAYPKGLFWHEQGYRFSWRVMLVEKMGHTQFYVKTPDMQQAIEVDNRKFLSPAQEKQMSFQPDLILQFAHFLAETYGKEQAFKTEVYVCGYAQQRLKAFCESGCRFK